MINRYNSLNNFLRSHFGERIYKISILSGCSCPNRDGRIDTRGCTFCHPDTLLPRTASEGTKAPQPIANQIEQGLAYVYQRHATTKAIAHFQSGTNTYGDLKVLSEQFHAAADHPQIRGVSISTRPDCLHDEHISMLLDIAKKTFLWIELGLQSSHDTTLLSIRRGHTAESFRLACQKLHDAGIRTCGHVILGLPGETHQMMMETAHFLNGCHLWGVKIHNLFIVRGTEMEEEHLSGNIAIPSLEEYATVVVDFLEQLDPAIVIHRFNSHGPRRMTLAPHWSINKLAMLNAVERELKRRKTKQGRLFPSRPC